MIDQDLKEKIIETLGKHYSADIIQYLNDKAIYNANDEPFSRESIRLLVNAHDKPEQRENLKVESAIIELLEIKIEETKKLQKRKKLLKKQ